MCIITYIPKNQKITDETLRTMFSNNKDGAGLMFSFEDKLFIRKGYMDVESLIRDYHKIPKDINVVIHFRIGTCGTNSAELTHPYPVTTDLDAIKKTSYVVKDGFAFAHNGILRDFSLKGDYNDSQAFGVTYLAPLAKLAASEPDGLISNSVRPIIEGAISGSRIIIMNTDGRVEMYGRGWVEDDGVFYSNTSYKSYNYNHYFYNNHSKFSSKKCGKPHNYTIAEILDDYDSVFKSSNRNNAISEYNSNLRYYRDCGYRNADEFADECELFGLI